MSLLLLVKLSYFVAATLFLLGLQRMASPKTARSGIQWAGVGMLIATIATFFLPDLHNIALIAVAIVLGVAVNWMWGKKVAITDMPQMVALFNGMGGGSAAAIGAVELLRFSAEGKAPNNFTLGLAVVGALIGAVSLTGSVIAWAKLDGRMDKRYTFPGQQAFNALVALASVGLGVAALVTLDPVFIIGFFIAALLLGVLMTLPIGGADMPVVISLYNAFTGLAVAFEGYVLGNEALIIAGMMVGAAGMLLTKLMAKAMNRSIQSVLFSNFGATGEAAAIEGSQKPIDASDVAAMMAFAERVVIVYDLIVDMDDINPEFANTDVSLVIGANDVVNPVAKTDPNSPIYGMPILDVVNSKNTIVIKRGKGTGFAGIENALFYADNTRMLYGDGADMANQLVSELKALDGGH